MRILFVSQCYPSPDSPQYGIFIKQQENALRELGHQVDVLMPAPTGKDGQVQQREDGTYTLTYRTLRYDVFPLLCSPKARKSIRSLIQTNGYDLVAVHITDDGILKMVVDACDKCGTKVVAHYHGLNVWEEYTTIHPHRQKLYAARRLRILKRTHGVVGVSNKVRDIVGSRLKNVPIQTVYNGVDVELFRQSCPEEGSFRVIGVGNLIEIKGFAYLLEAFSKLHNKYPHTRLDIVGDGVLRDSLQEKARMLGIEKAVTFHGKVPYDRVAELMQKSHLFVLPSFYEALGCVYLEAMGCGLPTIGIKGMGIDEIIVHGENGLLAEPKNSQDLFEKMYQVATDPALQEDLARCGEKTAREYTWAASGKALEDFYKECVKQ